MSELPTVAIAGATGAIGKDVAEAFLSPQFRPRFKDVVLLSRSKDSLSRFTGRGARLETYNMNDLTSNLRGVDILVDTIRVSGHDLKEGLIKALPGTSVKLYVPSEFGVNHLIHKFAHPEWDTKKRLVEDAYRIVPGIKISRLFVGLFLEMTFGPWFGFSDDHYEVVAPKGGQFTVTSQGDIGRAVASLVSLPQSDIPDYIHIAGDTKSPAEVAEIMEKAGGGKIKITELSYDEAKKRAFEAEGSDPLPHLRFLMVDGSMNHTKEGLGNDNELVNPGGKLWTWKTIEDFAKEKNGRPNAHSPEE